jgi:hypothetical protein
MGKTTEKELDEPLGTEAPPQPGAEQKTPEEAEDPSSKPPRKAWGVAGWLRRKPVLFAFAAMLLAGVGLLAFRTGSMWTEKTEKETSSASLSRSPEDGLRQEDLPRFYIPLPGGGPVQLLVVDFSVVWDPLSAVRFRKAEVSLRDRLYDSLTGLAANVEDLGDKPRVIEDEMGRVFREALRTEALSVKVRGVKAF